jgi:hypothetical protein
MGSAHLKTEVRATRFGLRRVNLMASNAFEAFADSLQKKPSAFRGRHKG